MSKVYSVTLVGGITEEVEADFVKFEGRFAVFYRIKNIAENEFVLALGNVLQVKLSQTGH